MTKRREFSLPSGPPPLVSDLEHLLHEHVHTRTIKPACTRSHTFAHVCTPYNTSEHTHVLIHTFSLRHTHTHIHRYLLTHAHICTGKHMHAVTHFRTPTCSYSFARSHMHIDSQCLHIQSHACTCSQTSPYTQMHPQTQPAYTHTYTRTHSCISTLILTHTHNYYHTCSVMLKISHTHMHTLTHMHTHHSVAQAQPPPNCSLPFQTRPGLAPSDGCSLLSLFLLGSIYFS